MGMVKWRRELGYGGPQDRGGGHRGEVVALGLDILVSGIITKKATLLYLSFHKHDRFLRGDFQTWLGSLWPLPPPQNHFHSTFRMCVCVLVPKPSIHLRPRRLFRSRCEISNGESTGQTPLSPSTPSAGGGDGGGETGVLVVGIGGGDGQNQW